MTSAVSNYSGFSFLNHLGDFATEELKDGVLEPITTAFSWVEHTDASKETKEFASRAVSELEPVKMMFAVPAFFKHANALRRNYQTMAKSDEWDLHEVSENALSLTTAGSESALCLDALRLIDLKESMNLAKGLFWSSIGLLDGVGSLYETAKIDDLHARLKELEKNPNADAQFLYKSRLNFSYLKVVKQITSVAIAAISLISIFFASLAQGIIFSPITFLSLCSLGTALHILLYFYEKAIKHQEKSVIDYRYQKM